MKFLLDAQLPRRLAPRLSAAGYETRHTRDLPTGNRSPDSLLLFVAEREQRAIVTKDADFVTSFILTGKPRKLLLISAGNLSNVELETLVFANLHTIVEAFEAASFVELTNTSLIIHA